MGNFYVKKIQIVLIILLFFVKYSLTWTDFSKTVINKDGIYDLNGIKATCPKNKVIRGFALDKPSQSTIRWALHCILPSNIDNTKKSVITKSTNRDDCEDSRMIWWDRHTIKCDENQVLHSFTFISEKQSKKCYFMYECIQLTNSLCHFNLNQATKTVSSNKGNLLKFPLLPVIANQKDSALIGFQFRNQYTSDVLWESFIFYGWCVTTLPNQNSKSTGIDIEVYFELTDKNMLNFLSDFYEYYRRIEKYISFTPHYLFKTGNPINDPSLEQDVDNLDYITNNCLTKGKYCYDKTDDENKLGRYYLLETLRHLCIHKVANDGSNRSNIKALYWDFIFFYNNQCNPSTAFRMNCGNELFEKYKTNLYQVMSCLSKSFGNDNAVFSDDLCDNENNILEKESVYSKEKNISIESAPSITIDGKLYIKLNPRYIFEEICLKLIKDLEYFVTPCAQYYKKYKATSNLLKLLIALFIIFISIIVIGIMYRNKMEKQTKKENATYVQLQEQK